MASIKIKNGGIILEIELVNKLYNLYLILLGGYALMAIGSIIYMIEMYRLYKKQEIEKEKIEEEIMNKLGI